MDPLGIRYITPDETAQPGVWGIDWTHCLADSEKITAVTATITDKAGEDVTAGLCPGGAVFSENGTRTTCGIADGVSGEDYMVSHAITTSAGNEWENAFLVRCRPLL